MWNCRRLLCLVVIGLATRGASSMNEQPHSKNDFPKTKESDASFSSNTNLDGKRKARDDPSVKDGDQILRPSPTPTAAAEVEANLTNSNVTVAIVPETGAATSINASKVGFHEQSHSKRHFRRSKLYRKEARAKSHTSLTKSNVASGYLIPFGNDPHLVVPSQNFFHTPDHNNDSIKLLESTSKTSSTGPSTIPAVTTSRDDSISTAFSRSLFTSGSKAASDRKFDKSSSRLTVSSVWTGNSKSSSTSSGAGSIIDEKSSSVELMTFTFDNSEEVRQSTSPNELMNRVESSIDSASIAMNHSLSTPKVTISTSDRYIDRSKSASADISYGGIDRGKSIQSARNDDDNDDVVIYGVHTDESRDAGLVPIELSGSSENSDYRRIARSNNDSRSTGLKNNSNHSRPDVDGYSWVSADDSLNRISLTEVSDTPKNVDLHETPGSYSYSNSTLSQDTDTSLESKIQIPEPNAIPAEHSPSLVARSPRELRPSMSSDPEVKSSDHSYASPAGTLTERIERSLKLARSNIGVIVKDKTTNNIVVEDVMLPRPSASTSTDLSSSEKALDEKTAGRKNEPFRLVLDSDPSSSRCSSNSSTERLQNIRRIDNERPFYGKRISEREQCLTRSSSVQTPLYSIHEPERSIEALVSPVIPSNSEEKGLGVSLAANRSHEIEAEAVKSSPSQIDEHPGAQSFVSSGFIILDNFEPVVHESLASEEAVVPFETETTTAGHFFAAFADLEENCNASSLNVFIPSVNSRESVATVKPGEELVSREPQNLTTEDSLYIIEGFGFVKNSADQVSELEDEFDRRRELSFDYGETETYPGYAQQDDHIPAVKLIDQFEFEAELPIKQEPLIAPGIQWKGNVGDRTYDLWWLDDEFKRGRGRVVKNDDTVEKTLLIRSELLMPKEVQANPSLTDNVLPDMNDSNNSSYHIFLLPTVYVLIGICVVLVGCSIWCSKISVKRQPNLPKLTYFIHERQEATQGVV